MGKTVPNWQTFLHCDGGSLIIRHLKSGLAEDLEIPWPEKLRHLTCEKVRLRTEDLQPLSRYGKTLDTVDLKDCEIETGALSALSDASSLRCLSLENCGLSDGDFQWFKGTAKLEMVALSGNPQCTGAVIAQAAGSPLSRLYLQGTAFRDADIPLLLSFPQLRTLNLSNTEVTGTSLIQLAANRGLDLICGHERKAVSEFRAAQRKNWKKKLSYDEAPAGEAMQLVRNFHAASRDRRQCRSRFVTQRYLDFCKARGYNGVDPGQKVSFCDSSGPPCQNCRAADMEQITRKKFYVYCERDDLTLTQERRLVVQTEDGWKIDKNERLMDGKWRFWPLD